MISVIIPVYNGKRYIEKCYESICRQTYGDWEAVFVDDGSTDDSRILLDSLACRDPRVKVIYKSNEGVAVARQKGIEESKGCFLTFLDVDDELLPDSLELLVNGFLTDNIDIVAGGMQLTRDGDICKILSYKSVVISGIECFKRLCCGDLKWQLCGKAYRRKLFDDVVIPYGIKAGEDMAVCLQLAIKASRVRVLNCIVYDYVQNGSSVTHARLEVNSIDTLRAALFVESVLQDKIGYYDLSDAVDSLYMLCVSSALSNGISSDNEYLKYVMDSHFSFCAIKNINCLKAINIALFRYFHINLVSYR